MTPKRIKEIHDIVDNEEIDLPAKQGEEEQLLEDEHASLTEDEELEPEDEELESEVETEVLLPAGGGAGVNVIQQYFTEAGQIRLLSAGEERVLGVIIEEGKYLSKLEQEWLNIRGTLPSTIDLLFIMGNTLSNLDRHLEVLCQHLKIDASQLLSVNMTDEALHKAIDGPIDPELIDKVANVTDSAQNKAQRDLVQLSTVGRLIPWHLLGQAAAQHTLSRFNEVLQSAEFRHFLDEHSNEISRYFEQIKERGREATGHLVRANLRLVIAVAKRYAGKGIPLLDLVQEGNLGLLHAVDRFDYRRGYKFSTYATWWIRQSISRTLANQSRTVRLPVHMVDSLVKLDRARQRLSQRYGRRPTSEELAKETGISTEKADWLMQVSAREPISLETPIGEEGEESSLSDFVRDETSPSPEEQATHSLLKDELQQTLATLTPKERRVIELRFGLKDGRNRTLDEIGAEFSLTRERIRQIEHRALAKLRHPSRSRRLKDYLE